MTVKKTKLLCVDYGVQVKIEVNTVMRGHLYPLQTKELAEKAQNEFRISSTVQILSKEELFGGKICAALDRQHPRDLFDVKCLFDKEGELTETIKNDFLICLLSGNRPLSEMLKPNLLDQKKIFESEFIGMALEEFSYQDFEETRERLLQDIKAKLTNDDKVFLLSFKQGTPDWAKFALPDIEKLPAVQWKLANIQKFAKTKLDKHTEMVKQLENMLFS